ncbi:MAG: hypothetical protein AAF191_16480, partial [Verrucomicrobiota bacterium]
MRRVIHDHYARWGVLWILLAVIFGGFAFGVWTGSEFAPFGVMAAGSFSILMDVQRGAFRSIRSLPVPAKQLSRGC